MLMLVSPLGLVADDPPGPTTRHLFRTDGRPLAGPAEMVTFVLEFPPGAQTPAQTHPGQVFVTLLAGEITFRRCAGGACAPRSASVPASPVRVLWRSRGRSNPCR